MNVVIKYNNINYLPYLLQANGGAALCFMGSLATFLGTNHD
jgi:hypothetical protein